MINDFNLIGQPIDISQKLPITDPELAVPVSIWGETPNYLYADRYKNRGYMKFNGYLKNFFFNSQSLVDEAQPKLLYDQNISIKAKIGIEDVWVLRGTEESYSLILTKQNLVYYQGYPLDVAVMLYANSRIQIDLDVIHQTTDIMVAVAKLENAHTLTIRYGVPPRLISKDIEQRKAPEHPFYVRWINPYGGYDYHMFVCDQKRTKKLDSINTIEVYGSGEKHMYAHDASEQVTTSTGIITKEEAEIISHILYSPLVSLYNKTSGEWEEIQPVKGSKVEWMSSQPTGEIIMTFDVKNPIMI